MAFAEGGVRMTGLPDIKRDLKKLDKTIAGKAIRTAYRESFRIALEAVRRAAPKSLRKTFKIRALKRSRVTQGVQIRSGTRAELGLDYEGSYYPAILEYGTKRVTSRPFMRQAYDENEEKVFADFNRRARSLIDKALKK